MQAPPCSLRLGDLVAHAEWLDVATPLAEAHAVFSRCNHRFLGVLSEGRFAGVASRRMIAEMLSLKFGRALFDRSPIGSVLAPGTLTATPESPLTELLKTVSSRSEENFYDDIALVSPDKHYIGMIPVERLVRLQTELLLDNLARVESQRTELAAKNQRMEEDLRMAREVQLALLPEAGCAAQSGDPRLQVFHTYQAAEALGGDFYALFPAGPSRTACCIFDVMGHGVRSALITAILKALLEQHRLATQDPGELLTRLNRELEAVLRSVQDLIFVTAAIVVIDTEAGALHLAQAGHPIPLLHDARGNTAAPVSLGADFGGAALGLLVDEKYPTASLPFKPGDALLLYTDGLVEIPNALGAELGETRLALAFSQALHTAPSNPTAALVDSARAFGAGLRFQDDVCAIILKGSHLNS